jgi:cell division protein FtsL
MHSDHPEIRTHKNKHLAERFEGLLGTMMVVVIVMLAVGAVYMAVTGDSTPSWMH